MKTLLQVLLLLTPFFFVACDDEMPDPEPELTVPETYRFERDGASTVSFSGQTTRLKMGEELAAALSDFDRTEAGLLELFANQTADGGDADPYTDAELNASTKSIRSKTAASEDYFSANTVASADIRADFEAWIAGQVNEVFPAENELAAPGQPGQIADGSSVRYVNAQGLEYNQAFIKGLIGALVVDQMLNNYLSTGVLDAGDNRDENDRGVVATDQAYTTMEHKWDEAYGYLYGLSPDEATPNNDLGADSYLNKYLGRVEGDADFAGIADEIYSALKRGRAAIVAGDYTERDAQADIVRQRVSEIIGIRAVYYLQQGKTNLANGDTGAAFHDLSEGYGFIYSLMFTRKPGTDGPYFTKAETEALLTDLMDDGANGLWDVEDGTLDDLATQIADRFEFSLEEAAN